MDATLVLAEPYTAFANNGAIIQNDVAGQVAVIGMATLPSGFESTYGFSMKAFAAQKAGAVGVIFVNDDQENPGSVWRMGSAGETVTIPVAMVSYDEGSRIQGLGSGTPIAFPGQSCETLEIHRFASTEIWNRISALNPSESKHSRVHDDA